MKNLNNLLADLVVMNQKVYTLHWNVKGPDGFETHKLTDDLYNGLIEFIDQVGEKIKMTGDYPVASLKEVLDLATIKEIKAIDFTVDEVVRVVVDDLNALEAITLEIKPDHRIQPLFDEIFMFIDKQRYLFGLLSRPIKSK